MLFREGEPGECMFVLLEGSADIRAGEVTLESATPGALLEEMALVDPRPRTATVIATSPSRLAHIDQRRFQFLVQQMPYFATHVMKVLAPRLRHVNLLAKGIASRKAAPTPSSVFHVAGTQRRPPALHATVFVCPT